MFRMQRTFIAIFTLFAFTVLAHAQSGATFLSAQTGTDAGACSLAQPCRNLTYALTQTQASGVITILDSGDYAPTTINKAITIQAAPGVTALIASGTTPGIFVGAATTDFVTLRNLSLDGLGTATFGIQSSAAGGVQIENCTVKNYTGAGIQLTGTAGKHAIANTVVQHCANGIVVATVNGTATTTTAVITNCLVEKISSTGISITASGAGRKTQAAIYGTTVTGSGANGFSAGGSGGGTSEMMLENCTSTHNSTGISSANNTTIRVSNSVITGNTQGLSGPTILTRSNNSVEANTTQGNFGGTFSAK